MIRNNLEHEFKILVNFFPTLELQMELAKLGRESENFNEVVSHFEHEIEERYIKAKDIVDFRELYKLEEKELLLSSKALAQKCAELFCYYLKNVVLPNESLGVYIGTVYLTGTKFVHNITELYGSLKIGDEIKIVREKTNPHDDNAIKVTTLNDEKLGYVPAKHNLLPSQMIDFGSALVGEVKKLFWNEKGVSIKIMLYTKH